MASIEERVASLESGYGTLTAQEIALNDRLQDVEDTIQESEANMYNSSQTGEQIDSAVASVRQNGTAWTGKSNKGVVMDLTLDKDGWDAVLKTQTLSDPDLLATTAYRYFVGSVEENEAAYTEAGVKAKNITTAGQITFQCEVIPEVDLDVEIVRVEVQT